MTTQDIIGRLAFIKGWLATIELNEADRETADELIYTLAEDIELLTPFADPQPEAHEPTPDEHPHHGC